MAEEKEDRRQYRRVKAQVKVAIQKYDSSTKDVADTEATTKNMSVGGLLVEYDKPLEVPSYVIVTFAVPGSEEKMDFVGKVIRIEELPAGGYEVGVMFMRMIFGEIEKLDQFVKTGMDKD